MGRTGAARTGPGAVATARAASGGAGGAAAAAAPPHPPPRLRCNRYVYYLAAVFQTLTCSGAIFGWVNMAYILQKEGFFASSCAPDPPSGGAGGGGGGAPPSPPASGCKEQVVSLNGVYSIASVFAFVVPLGAGLFLGRYGPSKTTRILSCVFAAGVATLLGAAAAGRGGDGRPSPAAHAALYPAFIALGAAASSNILPLYSVANLFPARRALALSVLSGSFDAGALVFLVFARVVDAGVPLATVVGGYLGGPVAIMLLFAAFLWPEHPFEAPAADDAGAGSGDSPATGGAGAPAAAGAGGDAGASPRRQSADAPTAGGGEGSVHGGLRRVPSPPGPRLFGSTRSFSRLARDDQHAPRGGNGGPAVPAAEDVPDAGDDDDGEDAPPKSPLMRSASAASLPREPPRRGAAAGGVTAPTLSLPGEGGGGGGGAGAGDAVRGLSSPLGRSASSNSVSVQLDARRRASDGRASPSPAGAGDGDEEAGGGGGDGGGTRPPAAPAPSGGADAARGDTPAARFLPAIDAGRLSSSPLLRQMASPEYVVYLLFFATAIVRFQFFIGSLSAQLDALGQVDAEYSKLFGYILPAGAVSVIPIGAHLDAKGPVVGMAALVGLAVALSALNLVPSLPAQTITFVLFAAFRASLFCNMSVYLAAVFGYRNLGALVGLLTTVGGLIGMTQGPLLVWAYAAGGGGSGGDDAPPDFLPPNLLMLGLTVAGIAWPLWLAHRAGAGPLWRLLCGRGAPRGGKAAGEAPSPAA
jgi:hypothetical protein